MKDLTDVSAWLETEIEYRKDLALMKITELERVRNAIEIRTMAYILNIVNGMIRENEGDHDRNS